MDVKELAKRHQQNLAIAEKGREESGTPEPKHKQGRGEPNGQSDFDDELHQVYSPFVSCMYIIPYLTVKKQQSLSKVYVKFAAGRIINIDLT